ncbi:MAG: hypothetical protein KF852_07690 [Saprospiraceae bacterium]|nr:hypothetical protein [Saprospiraceae bacterium]
MQSKTLFPTFGCLRRALSVLVCSLLCAWSAAAQSEEGGRIEIPSDQIPCICPSGGMGSISLIAEGSAGPFTFLWAGPDGYLSTEQNPADLPTPGQYSVTVTNAYGCAVTLEAEVPACDGVPEVELTPEPACPDSENGRIVLTFPDDDSGYTYLWSNGSTGRDLTGVGAGVFSVTITEGGGCTRVSEASIPEEQPMSISAEVVGVCQGQSDGSIDMSVSGGQMPYTYQWSNGWPLEDMDPASSGLFKVTVTDAGNCRIIGDFTVPLHPLPAISGAVQLSSCVSAADGSVDITVEEGAPPFVFAWNTGSTAEDLQNVIGALYTVTVTDGNGCTATGTFNTLPVAPQDKMPYIKHLRMYAVPAGAGSEELIYEAHWAETATGCLFFVPNTIFITQPLFDNIAAGQYGLRLEAEFSEAMAANPSVISLNLFNTVGSNVGGNIWSFTYLPTVFSGIVQNGRIEETFVFSGEDLNGNALFDLRSASANMTACADVPEYMPSCVWSPPVSGAGADNVHTLRRACMRLNIAVNPENFSASASIQGGTMPYTYLWEGPGGFISDAAQVSGLDPGSYCLKVADAAGCVVQECFFMCKALEDLIEDLLLITPPCPGQADGMLCLPGSTDFPLVVSWPDGSDNLCMAGIEAGQSYCFTVTELQCMQEVEYCTPVIQSEAALHLTVVSTRAACPGQSNGRITVSALGGRAPYEYVWANGQTGAVALGLPAGICHSVTVTDACGESFTACFTVPEAPPVTVGNATVNNACGITATGSVVVQVTGGLGPLSFLWMDDKSGQPVGGNQPFLNQALPGNYTFTVTDACGNTSSLVFSVGSSNTNAEIVLGDPVVTPACAGQGGAVNISVSSPPAYPPSFLWSNGATTEDITNLTPGMYTVTITNAYGCEVIQIAEVEDIDFEVTLVQVLPAYCGNANGKVQVGVLDDNAYTYKWSDGFIPLSLSTRVALTAGPYNVTVTRQGTTCSKVFSFEIPAVDYEVQITGTVQNQCGEGTGSVSISLSPFSFVWNGFSPQRNWSNGATGNHIHNLSAGQYCVTVSDGNGCTAPPACFDVDYVEPNFEIEDVHIIAASGYILTENYGSIKVTLSGQGPFTYAWSNGTTASGNFTSHTLTGLSPGPYSITITNTTGCRIIRHFQVPFCSTASGGGTPRLSIVSVIPIGDPGDPPGAINMDVANGTPPYEFKWTGPGGFTANTLSIAGLTQQGVYSLQVTDFCGRRVFFNAPMDCSHVGMFNVDARTQDRCRDNLFEQTKIIFNGLKLDNSFSGFSFGSIGLSILGGTPVHVEYLGPPDFEVRETGITNWIAPSLIQNDIRLKIEGPLSEHRIYGFNQDPPGLYCLRLTDVFGCQFPDVCSSFDQKVCKEGLVDEVIWPGDDYIIAQYHSNPIHVYSKIGSCQSCQNPFMGVCDQTGGETVHRLRYIPEVCDDPCRGGGKILGECPSGQPGLPVLITILPGTPYYEYVDGDRKGCLFNIWGEYPGIEESQLTFNPQLGLPIYVESICVQEDQDSDGDGIPDGEDNCPLTYNPDQLNCDGDEYGNVCDPSPGVIYTDFNLNLDTEEGCTIEVICDLLSEIRVISAVELRDDPVECVTRTFCIDRTSVIQGQPIEWEIGFEPRWEYCMDRVSIPGSCRILRRCPLAGQQNWEFYDYANPPCTDYPDCFVIMALTEDPTRPVGAIEEETVLMPDVGENSATGGWALQKAWPNPFTREIFVDITADTSTSVYLYIIDILGFSVFQMETTLQPGENRLTLNPPAGLAPGIYSVLMRDETGHHTARLMVKL